MTPQDLIFPPRYSLHYLRQLVLLSAEVLLCPLYWQIHFAAPQLLLALVQLLIAGCIINGFCSGRSFRQRLTLDDWQLCKNGDYYMELDAQQHHKGCRPNVEIYTEESGQARKKINCLRLIDRHGTIRIFSDHPLKCLVEISSNPETNHALARQLYSQRLSAAHGKPNAKYHFDL